MQPKIVLVTGGAGFIGSNFIRYLLHNYPDYKVINFDKLTYAGNLDNLTLVAETPNYAFVRGDIASQKDVKNVFEEFNPDYVVHFAAESHVDRSFNNPDLFLATNVLGTQMLLNYSHETEVEKFVYISTDEVYGSVQDKCGEYSKLAPNNPYAASKAAADLLIRVAYQTYRLNVNTIRSCNNYGPYQFPEKLIPVIICNALKGKEIPIFGEGNNIRTWMHVDDHCRAIDLVLHNAPENQIYNVSTDDEWQNIELAKFILDTMDVSHELITYVPDRISHDYRYAMNSDKIRKQLGWQPAIDFKLGIEQTIGWYKNHQDWVEAIVSGEYMEKTEGREEE
jgi:dTDP-glucose 4,6-dehydratase